ncbi:MAG: rhodanese-like domain-containing protein [Pigmentiphaga sp.]|nr:rhodanese-like domain-containing protein [Pigmentiphaga sp.]
MIDAATLHRRLRDARRPDAAPAQELALVDIREPGEFKDGHLLLASNLPLSRLEWLAPSVLPRLDVSVVVCAATADDPRLARAASALRRWGYTTVKTLDADFAQCEQAGFVVFTGFNVPSKAFGEWLERNRDTPHVRAGDLAGRLADASPPLVLDCRPADEHARGAVPGAVNLPGVELARRAAMLDPGGTRPIVVHCAGRTRGIVATQTLIDLGYPNPVQVLENGLMGWQLSGHELGATQAAPLAAPPAPPPDWLVARAVALAERCGARAWSEDAAGSTTGHTVYGFSVGTADEAARLAPEGFHAVPGGQLLQGLDDHVAVQGARLIIHAPDPVRAALTAAYLCQMGWNDVWWLNTAGGKAQPKVSRIAPQPRPASAAEPWLVARPNWWREAGTLILDLGNSRRYREQHLPGAQFAARALLPQVLQPGPRIQRILLCCDDGELSAAASDEVAELTGLDVFVLQGGVTAWADAGGPVASDPVWLTEAIDVATTPYDYRGDLAAQMQAYIDWELALEAQVERDGVLRFRECRA